MPRVFNALTKGYPEDGQGSVYYLAGTPVEIVKVSMGKKTGAPADGGSEYDVLKALVKANGYRITASKPQDKAEGEEIATVDADSIIVTI